MANQLNLLSTQSRVAVPFIKVTIGTHVFGVFEKTSGGKKMMADGVYKLLNVKYPNFVQSLTVKKINGQVNQYTLQLAYQINQNDDPNLIEKILSSVSKTRSIKFSYGDLSAPTFIYKDEEAIITGVKQRLSMSSAQIIYTISATSKGILTNTGAFTFKGGRFKPSDRIKQILFTKTYGLQEVFTGMRDKSKVLASNLIASNDQVVEVATKTNVSVLEYISYLVKCMTPIKSDKSNTSLYTLCVVDDTSGNFDGTYFKIIQVNKTVDTQGTVYELEIGVPGNNIVTAFNSENDEAFSIYYNYSKSITDVEYTHRIDNQGNLVEVYAPIISSKSDNFKTNASQVAWWKSVTEYPLKASITIKGLLRPAILMTHLRLKLYYYGRLHILSGLYIVTSQVDTIDDKGFTTTLGLTRVGGDNSI